MELQESRLAVQRLEAQVQHADVTAQRNQRDFELAIQARDDAVRESNKLRSDLEALEDRGRKAVSVGLNDRGRKVVSVGLNDRGRKAVRVGLDDLGRKAGSGGLGWRPQGG